MNWNEIAAELSARPLVGLGIALGLVLLAAIIAGQIGLAVLRSVAGEFYGIGRAGRSV